MVEIDQLSSLEKEPSFDGVTGGERTSMRRDAGDVVVPRQLMSAQQAVKLSVVILQVSAHNG